jgi:hypothetical protein
MRVEQQHVWHMLARSLDGGGHCVDLTHDRVAIGAKASAQQCTQLGVVLGD